MLNVLHSTRISLSKLGFSFPDYQFPQTTPKTKSEIRAHRGLTLPDLISLDGWKAPKIIVRGKNVLN
jgi:hypothetical protein